MKSKTFKGAIDNVELGNLTVCCQDQTGGEGNLIQGRTCLEECRFCRRGGAKDDGRHALWLESKGTIKIAGSMYDLETATVDFLA